ncbi:MAG: energy transducer TonB [Candidatus Sericytochromatia bacterium]|nr:energy transducer TonB [Candidatus Tanganyikabacteria bacterium]
MHAVILYVLLAVPAGQRLVQKIIPVQLVEKPKVPPRIKRPPPPRAKERAQARPQHARPRTALAPPAAGDPGDAFGVAPDDGGAGTLEVPVGRTLEAPATPSEPAAPPTPPPLLLSYSDDARSPEFEREPAPIGPLRAVYPEVPRLAGATGSAVIEAYVDAAGLVVRAVLARASAPAFGRSALDAVRQTRFKPAVRLGVPVARSIRVPVAFDLAGNAAPVVTATVSVPIDDAAGPAAALSAPASENVESSGSVTP